MIHGINKIQCGVYPYNHVFESESGHVMEIDDTKDNERLFTQHRTGTSQEIDKDGNRLI